MINRFRRQARRVVRRMLGLSTRPLCATPGEAFVFDYLADWCPRAAARSEEEYADAVTVAEEWEHWRVIASPVGDEVVRAAAWWPLLRGPVRGEVESAVAAGIARTAGAVSR